MIRLLIFAADILLFRLPMFQFFLRFSLISRFRFDYIAATCCHAYAADISPCC